MSAKTRLKNLEKTVGALTLLFLAVIDIIRKGNRSERMISQLKRALQLVKENRLVVVLGQSVEDGVATNIQELLSVRLDSLGLSSQARSQTADHGVEYVGGLFHSRNPRFLLQRDTRFSEEHY